jgi:hypothetical protein
MCAPFLRGPWTISPEQGLELAAALEGFWLVREQAEGASWLEPLLAQAPNAEPVLRAHALRALGGALQLSGEPERAAPHYQQSLELFVVLGDEVQAANLRYRVAGNMVDMGETVAAWPLLEESQGTFRELGLPRGEAQVLGYLVDKAYGDGDLDGAIELALESAGVARRIGWAWWGGRPASRRRLARARARQSRCRGGGCPSCARALPEPRRPAQVDARCGRAGRSRLNARGRRAGRPSLGGDRKRTRIQACPAMGEPAQRARSPRPSSGWARVQQRASGGQPHVDRRGRLSGPRRLGVPSRGRRPLGSPRSDGRRRPSAPPASRTSR